MHRNWRQSVIGLKIPQHDRNINNNITSVADIEEKTGYKFFTMLDEAIAADVKAQNNPSDWGIN